MSTNKDITNHSAGPSQLALLEDFVRCEAWWELTEKLEQTGETRASPKFHRDGHPGDGNRHTTRRQRQRSDANAGRSTDMGGHEAGRSARFPESPGPPAVTNRAEP